MPSKIKSKLLIVTVFCATLAILFLIAPATAEIYSLILLGVSLLMATLAGFNARETVELQYKVSSFITLAVFIFVGMTRPSIDYETDIELPNKAERQINGFVHDAYKYMGTWKETDLSKWFHDDYEEEAPRRRFRAVCQLSRI